MYISIISMWRSVKKIVTSKWFKYVFSAILIVWAFHRINITRLLMGVRHVNIWIIIGLVAYLGITMVIGGLRWSLLLFPKIKLKDVLIFTKATYLGAFYSLFFPTSVAGDLLKWVPLTEKYPELSKTTLASSAMIDRVIGFTAFAIVALLALILGKIFKYQFPDIIFYVFILANVGIAIFYGLVYLTDIDKLLGKWSKLKKVEEVVGVLKKENKQRIFRCLGLSLITEPVWIMTNFFTAKVFHVPLSPLQIFIFMPIISMILVLPISIAGFGARENLYLFFLSQLGIPDEKLLLMSAFGGILGVLNSLIGGIFLLF